MRKIKNDPVSYLTRAMLFFHRKVIRKTRSASISKKRGKKILTAPIDSAGYINFRTRVS